MFSSEDNLENQSFFVLLSTKGFTCSVCFHLVVPGGHPTVFFIRCVWLWVEPLGCCRLWSKTSRWQGQDHRNCDADGSPLVCEGPGESFVNLSATSGSKGGASRFDRATGKFEMVVEPGTYIATVRATDGFEVEDEKRGTVTPAEPDTGEVPFP